VQRIFNVAAVVAAMIGGATVRAFWPGRGGVQEWRLHPKDAALSLEALALRTGVPVWQ
jgi:hypothetical protein